jgi:hypothetical protein
MKPSEHASRRPSSIIEQGRDERNLGRWQWIVLKGKLDTKTCVINCYRPGPTWDTNQTIALYKKRDLDKTDDIDSIKQT